MRLPLFVRATVSAVTMWLVGTNYSYSSAPRCDEEFKRQCLGLMQESMQELRANNTMGGFSAAKAYCDAYHAACVRKVGVVKSAPALAAASSSADPPAQQTPTVTKRLFVRADSLDNPYPGLTQSPSAGQALGASIGYTNNDFVQTATKSGLLYQLPECHRNWHGDISFKGCGFGTWLGLC